MEKELYHRTRMTPNKIIKALQKESISINEREAMGILLFLREIAKIKVTAYLKKHEHGKGKNS